MQQKLNTLFSEHGIDALLISNVTNITYLTGFTGFTKEEREAFVLITKDKQYLFTNALYMEAAQKYIKDFTILETSSRNPLMASIKKLLPKTIKKLGFESTDLTVSEYFALKKEFGEDLLSPAPLLIEKLREIKTKTEIEKIAKACQLGDQAFTYITKLLKTGISEKEVATEIEFFFKKAGHTISFRPIVAFGENASSPHHVSSDKKLKKNELVLLDFGARFENYCSDMTRTFFFGKANEEQKKMYHAVLGAQEKAYDYLNDFYSSSEPFDIAQGKLRESRSKKDKQFSASSNSKLSTQKVDKIARDYIVSQGFPNIPHSLGHGIGLDVHEDPKLTPNTTDHLTDGMVFSIEPGIYLPGFGGVRIEDLVVIENNKPRLLTHAPKSLIELPA